MTITQDLIPAGRKNRPGKSNPCVYITIHNTGNADKGANAKAHANYVKGTAAADASVSWHYTVDEQGAYQHIPDNETAYHAGDGSGDGNKKSIGIEICMNSDGDILKATDNAAELTAILMKKHGIPIENVVQHYKWTKKDCPRMIRAGKPYNWDTFIAKVKAVSEPVAPTSDISEWAKDAWNWAISVGITDGTNPKGTCTREQMITFLYRASKGRLEG